MPTTRERIRKLLIALLLIAGVVVLGGLADYGCRKKANKVDVVEPKIKEVLGEDQNDKGHWVYNGETIKELQYDEEMFAGPKVGESQVKEVLGKAQIFVYKKDEKIVLDPESPYFKKLQLACEEMLASSEFLTNVKIETLRDSKEIKSKEWAIELTYTQPLWIVFETERRVAVPAFPNHVRIYRLLIPLTGELTHIEAKGVKSLEGKYIYLLLSPEIVFDSHRWEIGTIKDVQKIKDILNRFGINVP